MGRWNLWRKPRHRVVISGQITENFNEFDLSLPAKVPFIKKVFPGNVLLVLLVCVCIKLAVFAYSLYFYDMGFSQSMDNILVQLGKNWWSLEGLSDFRKDYVHWRDLWLAGTKLYSGEFNGRYLYPPVFFYIINIFARWTIFTGPIVMLICNILTGYFLFRLVLSLGATQKAANIMMVLCLLSPFNLFYSDFIWQNTGVVTLFIVVAMFKISQEKFTWGMVWIGVAMSIKQVAFLFYPFFVVGACYTPSFFQSHKISQKVDLWGYIKKIPLVNIAYYGLIPLIVFLVASFPFLYEDPAQYFAILFQNHSDSNYTWIWRIYSDIVPLQEGDFFYGYFPNVQINPHNLPYQLNYRSSLSVAFAWIGHVLGVPPQITAFFAVLFSMQVFLYISVPLMGFLYWLFVNRTQCSSDREHYWILWYISNLALFAAILFTQIGIYKYYFVTIIPAWSTFGLLSPINYDNWRHAQSYSLEEFYTRPSRMKSLFHGGGSYVHAIAQYSLQVLLVFANKWLAPALLYLPLFLLAAYTLVWRMFLRDLVGAEANIRQKIYKIFFPLKDK